MDHRTEKIKGQFERETAEHDLVVLRDDGMHRYLSFGKPGTGCMRADVVTWPGYLAYVGDMGSFVFSRLEDMFQFFRGKGINPSYWSEKVVAADRGGVEEWSRELFEERTRDDLAAFLEDHEGCRGDVEERFEEEVLWGLDGKSRTEAYQSIIEFGYEGRRPFQDWGEPDASIYTHRFLWCCFALVRIIELYDARR